MAKSFDRRRVEFDEPRRAPLPRAARRRAVSEEVCARVLRRKPAFAFLGARQSHVALERAADVDLPRTRPIDDVAVRHGRNRRLRPRVDDRNRDSVAGLDLLRGNRVHARAADPEVGDGKRIVRRVEPFRGIVHNGDEVSVRLAYRAPVVVPGRIGNGDVFHHERLGERAHVPGREET